MFLATIVEMLPALDSLFAVEEIPEAPRAIRRANAVKDSAKHGSYKFPRIADEYTAEARRHSARVRSAAAAAAVASADSEVAEDAALHARCNDPLAYSSDFGYIEA
jgi:hypothetical protein